MASVPRQERRHGEADDRSGWGPVAQVQGRVGPFDEPDRYALTELRSRGGEGELWLGTVDVADQQLPVAVKVVRPPAGTSLDEVSARLRAQAELLRSLDHPNLVKVREAFEGPEIHPEGAPDASTRAVYLVMNYVQGEDLAAWVARNPQRDVLEITSDGAVGAVRRAHPGDRPSPVDGAVRAGACAVGVRRLGRDGRPAHSGTRGPAGRPGPAPQGGGCSTLPPCWRWPPSSPAPPTSG